MVKRTIKDLKQRDIDRIVEMAWEDRTTFDAIQEQFGLVPGEVIDLMRREMKPSSFKMWRERTVGRQTKHGSAVASELVASVVPTKKDRSRRC